MKISISFLKSNYSLDETIDRINAIKYDEFIHVDILDGEYVDTPKTDLDNYIRVLEKATKPLDIHLMVNHPIDYIKRLVHLNPEIITVHWDSLDNLLEISSILKLHNIKMGLALNPNDDIYIIEKYKDIINLVLVMSVFPGKGGQKFLNSTPFKLEHINKLKNIFQKDYLVEVDGGINKNTIVDVKDFVDLAVSGSYICCSDNYDEKIKTLIDT